MEGKSFHLFTLFGVPVKVHWTFLALIGYVVMMGMEDQQDTRGIIARVLLVLGVFLCVVAHEYGHILSARRYGIMTHDVILSPLGGVARLHNIPEKPIRELVVAFMGPVVNLIIMAICFLGVIALNEGEFELGLSMSPENISSFLSTLFVINGSLFLFNLIPAFPMDGGRIFRALLSMGTNRVNATRIASFVGQGLAVVAILGVVLYKTGLFTFIPSFFDSWMLVFIGIFIFTSARNEYAFVKHKG